MAMEVETKFLTCTLYFARLIGQFPFQRTRHGKTPILKWRTCSLDGLWAVLVGIYTAICALSLSLTLFKVMVALQEGISKNKVLKENIFAVQVIYGMIVCF